MESDSRFQKGHKATVRLIDLTTIPRKGQMKALIGVLEDSSLGERREHPRKRYFTAVDYATESRSFKDFVRDVALGGLFIETHETFEVGQELSLILPLPDSLKPLKIACRVARCTPEGIGVQFNLETAEQRLIIEGLVEQIED